MNCLLNVPLKHHSCYIWGSAIQGWTGLDVYKVYLFLRVYQLIVRIQGSKDPSFVTDRVGLAAWLQGNLAGNAHTDLSESMGKRGIRPVNFGGYSPTLLNQSWDDRLISSPSSSNLWSLSFALIMILFLISANWILDDLRLAFVTTTSSSCWIQKFTVKERTNLILSPFLFVFHPIFRRTQTLPAQCTNSRVAVWNLEIEALRKCNFLENQGHRLGHHKKISRKWEGPKRPWFLQQTHAAWDHKKTYMNPQYS